MPFDKPISIGAEKLTAVIAQSVEANLRARFDPATGLVGLDLRRQPWILGFILRDLDSFSKANVESLSKTAAGITESIGGRNSPAVLIRDGTITVGFYPEINVDGISIGL